MNVIEIHQIFLTCSSLAIDTRKIVANSIFLAIKGENYDANLFAKEALEKGASYVIIDNPNCYIDSRTILVDNSLKFLQELAKYHRQYLSIPIIALTGSNGKTTTKELINVVLSKKFVVRATIGNLNNHIGVPLTLLSFDKTTEIGIVEMGANHQKEIEFLCDIAKPDYGYISNFGKAHLEGFGGVEGVIKGKSEMYNFLRLNDKKAFVNLDDDIQVSRSSGIRSIGFGLNHENSIMDIKAISANPFVEIDFNNVRLKSNLIGLYNANNINIAIAIGCYFGITDNDIVDAVESYVPENNRSQIIFKNSNEIILDAYNANPSSMKVALENFIQLNRDRKLVIIGDMFELGGESLVEHKLIVNQLKDVLDLECWFVGKYFSQSIIEQANFKFFLEFEEVRIYLESVKLEDKLILIKGSRGMALERILELI